MIGKPDSGHGEKVLALMREFNLFAVDTLFKPRMRGKKGDKKVNNATHIPKDAQRRPRKLDHILVSARWKTMVTNTEVKWGTSMHHLLETSKK